MRNFYLNVTLCENNCKYKGINYETKRIEFDCQTKLKMNIEVSIKEKYKIIIIKSFIVH